MTFLFVTSLNDDISYISAFNLYTNNLIKQQDKG